MWQLPTEWQERQEQQPSLQQPSSCLHDQSHQRSALLYQRQAKGRHSKQPLQQPCFFAVLLRVPDYLDIQLVKPQLPVLVELLFGKQRLRLRWVVLLIEGLRSVYHLRTRVYRLNRRRRRPVMRYTSQIMSHTLQ